ncbi:hypothetical protein H9P43_005464 [Blastocladiella emersonii ATCC 22665]|nr:hypothetical protein H9P43_005464 [Blastocladiella emersonii ATCC 22665]
MSPPVSAAVPPTTRPPSAPAAAVSHSPSPTVIAPPLPPRSSLDHAATPRKRTLSALPHRHHAHHPRHQLHDSGFSASASSESSPASSRSGTMSSSTTTSSLDSLSALAAATRSSPALPPPLRLARKPLKLTRNLTSPSMRSSISSSSSSSGASAAWASVTTAVSSLVHLASPASDSAVVASPPRSRKPTPLEIHRDGEFVVLEAHPSDSESESDDSASDSEMARDNAVSDDENDDEARVPLLLASPPLTPLPATSGSTVTLPPPTPPRAPLPRLAIDTSSVAAPPAHHHATPPPSPLAPVPDPTPSPSRVTAAPGRSRSLVWRPEVAESTALALHECALRAFAAIYDSHYEDSDGDAAHPPPAPAPSPVSAACEWMLPCPLVHAQPPLEGGIAAGSTATQQQPAARYAVTWKPVPGVCNANGASGEHAASSSAFPAALRGRAGKTEHPVSPAVDGAVPETPTIEVHRRKLKCVAASPPSPPSRSAGTPPPLSSVHRSRFRDRLSTATRKFLRAARIPAAGPPLPLTTSTPPCQQAREGGAGTGGSRSGGGAAAAAASMWLPVNSTTLRARVDLPGTPAEMLRVIVDRPSWDPKCTSTQSVYESHFMTTRQYNFADRAPVQWVESTSVKNGALILSAMALPDTAAAAPESSSATSPSPATVPSVPTLRAMIAGWVLEPLPRGSGPPVTRVVLYVHARAAERRRPWRRSAPSRKAAAEVAGWLRLVAQRVLDPRTEPRTEPERPKSRFSLRRSKPRMRSASTPRGPPLAATMPRLNNNPPLPTAALPTIPQSPPTRPASPPRAEPLPLHRSWSDTWVEYPRTPRSASAAAAKPVLPQVTVSPPSPTTARPTTAPTSRRPSATAGDTGLGDRARFALSQARQHWFGSTSAAADDALASPQPATAVATRPSADPNANAASAAWVLGSVMFLATLMSVGWSALASRMAGEQRDDGVVGYRPTHGCIGGMKSEA